MLPSQQTWSCLRAHLPQQLPRLRPNSPRFVTFVHPPLHSSPEVCSSSSTSHLSSHLFHDTCTPANVQREHFMHFIDAYLHDSQPTSQTATSTPPPPMSAPSKPCSPPAAMRSRTHLSALRPCVRPTTRSDTLVGPRCVHHPIVSHPDSLVPPVLSVRMLTLGPRPP